MYLVEVDDEDELAGWLACHHEELFEQELNGWYTDPALWPRERSIKLLQQWCSFELHTVVVDTGASPLEDDSEERVSHSRHSAPGGSQFSTPTGDRVPLAFGSV